MNHRSQVWILDELFGMSLKEISKTILNSNPANIWMDLYSQKLQWTDILSTRLPGTARSLRYLAVLGSSSILCLWIIFQTLILCASCTLSSLEHLALLDQVLLHILHSVVPHMSCATLRCVGQRSNFISAKDIWFNSWF